VFFFLQVFAGVNGEHPKTDVALNGNNLQGLSLKKKSFIAWIL
jgi:hypothetical protein